MTTDSNLLNDNVKNDFDFMTKQQQRVFHTFSSNAQLQVYKTDVEKPEFQVFIWKGVHSLGKQAFR